MPRTLAVLMDMYESGEFESSCEVVQTSDSGISTASTVSESDNMLCSMDSRTCEVLLARIAAKCDVLPRRSPKCSTLTFISPECCSRMLSFIQSGPHKHMKEHRAVPLMVPRSLVIKAKVSAILSSIRKDVNGKIRRQPRIRNPEALRSPCTFLRRKLNLLRDRAAAQSAEERRSSGSEGLMQQPGYLLSELFKEASFCRFGGELDVKENCSMCSTKLSHSSGSMDAVTAVSTQISESRAVLREFRRLFGSESDLQCLGLDESQNPEGSLSSQCLALDPESIAELISDSKQLRKHAAIVLGARRSVYREDFHKEGREKEESDISAILRRSAALRSRVESTLIERQARA